MILRFDYGAEYGIAAPDPHFNGAFMASARTKWIDLDLDGLRKLATRHVMSNYVVAPARVESKT